MTDPIVVKLGGSTLGSHDTALEDLVSLQKQGQTLVVVHGGGNAITQWMGRLNLPARFAQGLRVTDAQALEIVIAVLAGLVNKGLVTGLQALGGKAIGISGVDGGMVRACAQNPELGYVGEVVQIDPRPLRMALDAGYLPVVAPLGLGEVDGAITPLNINADTFAGELAAALGARRLIFLTDVPGVCDASGQPFPALSPKQALALMESGVVSGGMIPKVKACLRAAAAGAQALIVDGRQPHALLQAVEGRGLGTRIEEAL